MLVFVCELGPVYSHMHIAHNGCAQDKKDIIMSDISLLQDIRTYYIISPHCRTSKYQQHNRQ